MHFEWDVTIAINAPSPKYCITSTVRKHKSKGAIILAPSGLEPVTKMSDSCQSKLVRCYPCTSELVKVTTQLIHSTLFREIPATNYKLLVNIGTSIRNCTEK